MKSISPSGVILGPMTGIFMEALLADLFLRMIGNNWAGYLVAGIVSQLSAIVHKVGSLLIIYGFDIVKIYENLFEFAIRQFRNLDISPTQAILFIIYIYSVAGILASIIGYRIGRSSEKNSERNIRTQKLGPDTSWDTVSPGQSFHRILIIIHLVVLPALLFINNKFGLKPWILVLDFVYVLFCLVWYKHIKYRLVKPLFWIHLLIIGVLAGLFWKSPDSSSGAYNWDGWLIGGSLIIRAVLVITSFSALSAELRNPQLKSFLFSLGFGKIYYAVSMAFSALPLMMEKGISGKSFLSNPFKALRQNIFDADQWLYVLQQNDEDANIN